MELQVINRIFELIYSIKPASLNGADISELGKSGLFLQNAVTCVK
jgi:hypothetical protein